MTQRRVKELSNIEIDEISLVDLPANQHAKVAIAKRADEEDIVPDEMSVYDENGELLDPDTLVDGDIVFDSDGNPYAVQDDDGSFEGEYEFADEEVEDPETNELAVEEERELVEVGKAGAPKQMKPATGFMAGWNKPNKVPKKAGFAQRAGAFTSRNRTPLAAAGAGGAGALGGYAMSDVGKNFADEVREELSKALTDIERDDVISKALARVDEMTEALTEAQEIAKSERDLRLTREYISKAAEYNVPVAADELGPVLMRMADTMSYEDCEVIHKALTAAGEALYEEIGYIGGGDNVDVISQVDAYLSEGVSKAAEGISKAAAMEEFFAKNPEAYDMYLAERTYR